MKEIYYVYNNEAIASCIFLSVLKTVEKLDIARSCLILPFLLDDRTVNYLSKNQNAELDLDQMIKEQPRLFASFNKRYLSLLPVTINSFVLLSQTDQINMHTEITTNTILNLSNKNLGERFNKIEQTIPKFLSIIDSYTTAQLYKTLNVQL